MNDAFLEWWEKFAALHNNLVWKKMAHSEAALAAWQAATLTERERCAAVAKEMGSDNGRGDFSQWIADDFAAAIRKEE